MVHRQAHFRLTVGINSHYNKMPFSTRAMTPTDWTNIQYFHMAEFKAPFNMGAEFVQWLDHVRSQAGVAMRVTSSYRSKQYNQLVGGAEDSAHTDIPCNAVDVEVMPTPFDPHGNQARYAIVNAALGLGCTRIGLYSNGSIHLDRSDRIAKVMWHVVDNPA